MVAVPSIEGIQSFLVPLNKKNVNSAIFGSALSIDEGLC